jgi:hypothetical protein
MALPYLEMLDPDFSLLKHPDLRLDSYKDLLLIKYKICQQAKGY